jgi:hypothetical protein
MKKVISCILVSLLILTLFVPFTASAEEAVASAPLFYGIQTKDNGNDTQDVRFISLVESTACSAVGYIIKAEYSNGGVAASTLYSTENGDSALETGKIFSKINQGAYGKDVTAADIAAELKTENSAGILAVALNGVPTNIGDITFTVLTYAKVDEQMVVSDPTIFVMDESGELVPGWDGKTMNIKWYVDAGGASGNNFVIHTAADLAGLSHLVNYPTVNNYYDENGVVITDTDGDGSLEDEVGYSADRKTLGNKFAGKTISLDRSISLNGKAFVPIGVVESSFQGTFDGQGHTVSNFKIIASDAAKHPSTQTPLYFGLFATIHNAKVQNLTIDNMTMDVDIATENATRDFLIAPITGAVSLSTIENCNVYNVTVNLTNTGNGQGSIGYVACAAINNGSGSKITNCNVYNFVVNGDKTGMYQSADGFFGYGAAYVTVSSCGVLIEKPLIY